MKKVGIVIILLGIFNMMGCSYIIPSAVNIEPAETVLSEKKEVVSPPASQKSITRTIRIQRGNRNTECSEQKGCAQ